MNVVSWQGFLQRPRGQRNLTLRVLRDRKTQTIPPQEFLKTANPIIYISIKHLLTFLNNSFINHQKKNPNAPQDYIFSPPITFPHKTSLFTLRPDRKWMKFLDNGGKKGQVNLTPNDLSRFSRPRPSGEGRRA